MPFRLNARNVFLTYPRCATLPRLLGEFLQNIRAAQYIHVVREQHRDGTPHIHCLIQWIDKFNVRDERKFDFEGQHPNIQPARDVAAIEAYISKTLERSSSPEDEWKYGELATTSATCKWRKVAEAGTEADILSAALDASPRDFVIHNDRIREFARSKCKQRLPYCPRAGQIFRIPDSLATYMITEFTKPVGLCPWILREYSIITDNNRRIVLEPCCWSEEHDLERPAGLDPSDIIITGGECPICRLSTPPRHIWSQTT